MQDSSIQIIDNFLPKSFHTDIYDLLTSLKFPWFYVSNLSYNDDTVLIKWQRSDIKIKDTYGFTHIARDENNVDSLYFDFLKPIAYFLEEQLQEKINNLYRIRAVMTCKDPSFGDFYNIPHIDLANPHKTLIYYVNDSDGDTIIFKDRWRGRPDFSAKTIEQTISPKANRAVIFDGHKYHTGTVPTSNNRIILNMNFD